MRGGGEGGGEPKPNCQTTHVDELIHGVPGATHLLGPVALFVLYHAPATRGAVCVGCAIPHQSQQGREPQAVTRQQE